MSLLPASNISLPEWKGLSPHRFTTNRKHIHPRDTIKDLSLPLEDPRGRRHFQPHFNLEKDAKLSLKTFQEHNRVTDKEIKNIERKHLKFVAEPKNPRPERLHLIPNPSGNFMDVPLGIKTFKNLEPSQKNEFMLEDTMGMKTRVKTLSEKRNYLPISSLGDKIYKHPDYSTDFFKGGGLVPGSNIRKKEQRKRKGEKQILKIVHYKKDYRTWQEKVRDEERREEVDAVEGIEKWEENVLKEANPNWKDPEKTELPDLFAEREKGKEVKKPTKK
jgi:hypothetical protein